MINYDCREIILVLLKKWYWVLLCIILIGGLSVPLAGMSQKRVEEEYEELTSMESLFDITSYYYADEADDAYRAIFLDCLKDQEFMEEVIETYSDGGSAEVLDSVQYAYINENMLKIKMSGMSEEDADFAIAVITKYLPKYLADNHYRNVAFQESWSQKEKKFEVSELIQKPKGGRSNSKVIASGGICGLVIGCLVVMLGDYISKAKKEKRKAYK